MSNASSSALSWLLLLFVMFSCVLAFNIQRPSYNHVGGNKLMQITHEVKLSLNRPLKYFLFPNTIIPLLLCFPRCFVLPWLSWISTHSCLILVCLGWKKIYCSFELTLNEHLFKNTFMFWSKINTTLNPEHVFIFWTRRKFYVSYSFPNMSWTALKHFLPYFFSMIIFH